MFLSKIERANEELRRASARRARDGITPQHAAAIASLAEDQDEHQGEVPAADLTKAYRDAYCPPADFPAPVRIDPEDFRRDPVAEGHDAVSPGYEAPLSFPVQPAGSYRGPAAAGSYVDGDCA